MLIKSNEETLFCVEILLRSKQLLTTLCLKHQPKLHLDATSHERTCEKNTKQLKLLSGLFN